MIEENDIIVTNKQINELIKKNTEGVVLSVYNNGEAFLVEFLDSNGDTIGDGMQTVSKDDIELLIKVQKR
jgi:hypothetical protein